LFALNIKYSQIFAFTMCLLYFCNKYLHMQEYTLSILEDNSKALALLNYLKTLDFVKLTKSKDWYDELNIEQIKSINKGLEDIENGNIHKDEDVRKSIHKRILNAEK